MIWIWLWYLCWLQNAKTLKLKCLFFSHFMIWNSRPLISKSWHFAASEDIMTKSKSQGLHIIRIKYWNASGSGPPPSLILAHWNIGILLTSLFYSINRPPWANISEPSVHCTVEWFQCSCLRTSMTSKPAMFAQEKWPFYQLLDQHRLLKIQSERYHLGSIETSSSKKKGKK